MYHWWPLGMSIIFLYKNAGNVILAEIMTLPAIFNISGSYGLLDTSFFMKWGRALLIYVFLTTLDDDALSVIVCTNA